MKIKSTIQVELFENDARDCNQIVHIHPYYENEKDWSAVSIQDVDPCHFDRNEKPSVKFIFDNCNLDAIIQAFTIYRDNLKAISK